MITFRYNKFNLLKDGCDKVIDRKDKIKYKTDKSDILLIIASIITMIIIFFSDRDLGNVLFLLLVIVLPISLFLYWWDFRKQNK